MTNREMERRLISLEQMISEIHALLIMGAKTNPEPSKAEFDRVCAATRRGDKSALPKYIKRYGDRAPAGA